MQNILFFDTETTGLNNLRKDDIDPVQPMVVQLGMKLDDHTRTERMAVNVLLKPEGRWQVSEGAAKATGIDNKIADAYGCDFIVGCELFLDIIDHADLVVAHNIRYDMTVMRRSIFVYSQLTDQAYSDPFDGKTVCCTMMNCIDLVKAPPFKKGSWKWPKLDTEAYPHFFGEKLEGAHDALIDVRGCARVYYHLLDEGHI